MTSHASHALRTSRALKRKPRRGRSRVPRTAERFKPHSHIYALWVRRAWE
jgi:hypothetical protein